MLRIVSRFLLLLFAAAPLAAQPSITTAVATTSQIALSAPAGPIEIFATPDGAAAASCGSIDLPDTFALRLEILPAGGGAAVNQINWTGGSGTLHLAKPLAAGQHLCVAQLSNPVVYSEPAYAVTQPDQANFDFAAEPVSGTSTVSVLGAKGDQITIFAFPAGMTGAVCQPAAVGLPGVRILNLLDADKKPVKSLKVGSSPQTIALDGPLQPGDQLCLYRKSAAGVTALAASLRTVQLAAVQLPSLPRFDEPPSSDSATIDLRGQKDATLAVYSLPDSTNEQTESCADLIGSGKGTLLSFAPNGTSKVAATAPKFSSTDAANSFTLKAAPAGGVRLCLEETPADADGGSATPVYSVHPQPVRDVDNPNPYLRSYYTAGVVITNQSGSNGSSTASQYIDLGLAFTDWHEDPRKTAFIGRWGVDSFFAGRFSSLPVAATGTVTQTSAAAHPIQAAAATSSTSSSLNILSTQESGRVIGGVLFPFVVHATHDGANAFVTAPLIKGGFTTLLNPSASKTAASTSTASTSAQAVFAPVYWEGSVGLRMAYRHYPAGKDFTPRPITQLDITFGKFSNLQSLVCSTNKKSAALTIKPTNTDCVLPANGSEPPYYLDQSRATLGRVDIEGFFRIPSSIFVIGINANLPAYNYNPKFAIDTQNKTGGDVQILFGVSDSLVKLFKSLKLPGAD